MATFRALVPAQGLPVGSLIQIGDDDAIWTGTLSAGRTDESEYIVHLTIDDEVFTVPGNALISIVVTGTPAVAKKVKKVKKPKGDKKVKGDNTSKDVKPRSLTLSQRAQESDDNLSALDPINELMTTVRGDPEL